jgi:hypothetical protein
MWGKVTKRLRQQKQLRKAGSFVQANFKVLAFVAVFGLIGTYILAQSRAATGNDLTVTAVTMSPVSPTVGQAVTFSATIRNQGTTPTTAGTVVGVGFSVDGQRVTWNTTNTASLAAGASITLTANAGVTGATWATTAGPHTVVATADDTNAIPDELDEGNNARSLDFTIGNTGNLYGVSSATGPVLINNNVDVTVRLTPGTTVDGVQATLTYDQTKLQYVSMTAAGSPFDLELGPQTGGTGTVSVVRGNLSGGVSTDALVTKVTFRALAGTGSTTVQMSGNATKNGVYTNPTTAGATISFATPDTTAPVTAITAPLAGGVAYAVQTVTATATDAVGVTRVELYVDGQLRATDLTSPYTFSVDTKTLSNDVHTLQTRAYDAAGNVGSSSTVSVTVKNWAEDINIDGQVNLLDFSALASVFGQTGAGLGRSDINGDGKVDILDFSRLASKFGK